ncbi:PDZ and LIM domain protein Zasp isoform X13 [Drosophila subobscura]|uniref:PDZ and LIM domain protein Zasp isoform X13 n=1 Tax=Drosophila subobscura TaxID=7241 RepID=UPI00155A8889|nr:PDZ and LIM domain protein Zasp isoform X13 [Drosophila subobscura]
MAQPQLLQVKLSRFDAQPWGFRLQGGVDFAQPLLVQKVNAGSLSEQAGLQPGDAVIKINDVDVFNFRHKDAQDTVVRSGNNFVITVQRGGSTWRPQVTPTGNVPQANSPYLQTVTKTSLAHKQQDSQHIGCGYNNSARPFANGGGDGGVKSIVNKQYNTPVGIYSDESIAETLSAQAEVLAGGVLGVNFKKNEKEYQADRSEVLKFLREEETGQSTPEPHSPANFYWTQSHAIGGNERRTPLHHQHQDERIGIPLQSGSLAPAAPHRPSLPVAKPEAQEGAGQEQEQTDPRIIVLPICPALQGPEYKADMEAAAAALASEEGRPRPLSASGHPACQLCGVGIVGVFVRIKDKNLHVECFKCATCGTSLKNQGYYNFNNKLYCDIHAKQAAQNNPPAGTDGYVPVPIRPNTKLSANTISSALSSHGYGSNGYSNGNSTPAPAPPEPEPEPEPELVEAAIELPLPPPPSPTQLLQYEAEEEPLEALPATAVQVQIQVQPQQPPHQLKQQQQHTRTHSSLSSISSGSSSSGVGGSGSASGAGHSQQSSSTLSLDLDRDRYAYGSPMHSRQTSASSTSLDVSAVGGSGTGGGGGIQADNYTMPPSPPPPQPQTPAHAPFRVETSIRVGAQNENDMNTQNKGHNVYNQLLKEYSNKLQHQQHHTNNNNNNTTAHTQPRHNNNTAKPFATSSVAATTQQQPLVAALTATLANQLKFNSHQVASPQAALSTAAPATVVDSSSTNPTPIAAAAPATAAGVSSYTDNMSDEPSSIYGQMNAPQPTGAPGDPAFEYVTLTGNVIRSVQAPGKGPGISYKVNQGYARPYGASAGPPSAAPKSPVAYPPQQQQQSPRPAAGGNPYATLPRTNVGQQDEYDRPDQAQTPTRPFTPSMINKPAPIIPFYQTPEKLCFEECTATHARAYDQRALSPCFDRSRSPAPGPPPNPLSAIRAPRMKEPDSNLLSVSGPAPRLQAGSITTGQSYQGQLLAHSEQSSQSGSQSFSQQPETLTERQVGNLTVQKREQSSQLQQQQQSQSQSQTRTQVGNTQIERRRKVTEEFERTQSAKTIEIRTGSQSQSVSQSQSQAQSQSESTDRRSSYGKTGFVANQARRLSGLEQEITSLTSQSQAISARASAMGESNFPQLRSPTFDTKFPIKPAPVESIVPGYGATPLANKLVAPPPGFLAQQHQQQQQQLSAFSSTSSSVVQQQQQLQQQQQQQRTQSAFSSSTKATSSSLSSASAIASSSLSASASRSAQSASLTKASAITTTTNNQACSAFRSNVPGNGNNSKPNLASRPSIASITAQAPAPAPAPAPASAAPKSIIAAAASAPTSAPASFPPNLSDLNLNSNVDGSAGGGVKNGKGGFGATSAPKRGRGILNQAAAPGVRIPLCNSCNVQIRGPFITALGRIWCPDHFICVNGNCRRPLQDIGFVEEKGDLYCEYCFEKYLAPTCSKCAGKIKGDCLNAIGKHFHPECFTCGQCGKVFGNRPFFLEDGNAYCEADWNELFTTKCFACGFPVEAGDRWVEALNHNYHSQCFNCTYCKQNLEGQSFYNKGGRPFCKNHAR